MPEPTRNTNHNWMRIPFLSVLAGAVSIGLFVLMGKMIAEEATAAPAPTTVYTGLGEAEYPEEVIIKDPRQYEEPELPTRPQVIGTDNDANRDPIPDLVPDFSFDRPVGHGGTPGGGTGSGPALQNLPDSTPFPPYPGNARRNGIEGFVIVEMTIDSRGRVLDAKIVSSKPARVFDAATLRAVERWSLPSAAPEQGQQTIRRRLDFTLTQ